MYELSGDRLTGQLDPVANLERGEELLENNSAIEDALSTSQALLAETLEQLKAKRMHARTELTEDECYYSTEAALWYCHAEAERLRFCRAIIIQDNTATITDEERHQHMHEVRTGLHSAALAIENSLNPDAKQRLEYLIRRTLGIVEMANALTTPPFNQASRQFFRARHELTRADYILTNLELPHPNVHQYSLDEDQPERKTQNRAHDPHLGQLLALLERAESGELTYPEPGPPAKKGIGAILGFAIPRSRTAERHILEHPAFTHPAPQRASALLFTRQSRLQGPQ